MHGSLSSHSFRGCLPHAWESFLTLIPRMLTTCMGVFPHTNSADAYHMHGSLSSHSFRGCLPHAWESFLTLIPWILTTCMGVFPHTHFADAYHMHGSLSSHSFHGCLPHAWESFLTLIPWMLTTCMGVFPHTHSVDAYHMHGSLSIGLCHFLTEAVLYKEAHHVDLVVCCSVMDTQRSCLVCQEQITVLLHQEADTVEGCNTIL